MSGFDASAQQKRQDALESHPCLYCGASSGQPCTIRGGSIRAASVHVSRVHQQDGFYGAPFIPDKIAQAVATLDSLDESDPEVAHGRADDVLLASVDPRVRDAYLRLVDRCSWWAAA